MSEGTSLTTDGARTHAKEGAASALLRQLTLSRAREMARAGRYREAEQLLAAPDAGADSAPESLDLRARICAQEGRFAEAEKLWTRACQLEPANAAYSNALRRAAALRHHPLRRRIVVPLIICFSIVAVVFAVRRFRTQPAQIPQEALARGTDAQRLAQAETLGGQPQQAPASNPTASAAGLEVRLDVAGTTQEKTSDALLVRFDEGLFARGTALKADARERLAQLGLQLKPYSDAVTIEIIGLTDDLPVPRNSRYKDNIVLGMERARVIYDYLRTSAGLGEQTMVIGSLGERQASGSDAEHGERARRRTVLLRINARREWLKM